MVTFHVEQSQCPAVPTFVFHVKQPLARDSETVLFHVEPPARLISVFSGNTANSRARNVSRGTVAVFHFDDMGKSRQFQN